jgi:hypothetical protein
MSNYEQTDIRQRTVKTIEIQEPLLDSGDNRAQQRIKRPRPSLISRILSAVIWTTIAIIISWYFQALKGINEVLEEDNWKR